MIDRYHGIYNYALYVGDWINCNFTAQTHFESRMESFAHTGLLNWINLSINFNNFIESIDTLSEKDNTNKTKLRFEFNRYDKYTSDCKAVQEESKREGEIVLPTWCQKLYLFDTFIERHFKLQKMLNFAINKKFCFKTDFFVWSFF